MQFGGAVFLTLCFFECALSIHWLSLQHSNLQWNASSTTNRGIRSGIRFACGIARKRYGFAKIQAKLCRNSMEAMPYVQRAAFLAAETCQTVFGDRRWNCSSISKAPLFAPDLTRATREQAYVYAISSAALTYTMARACASGALIHCSCAGKPDEIPNESFQWGGCGDNLRWGIHFAKKFIDNVEKGRAKNLKKRELGKEDALVNLHNNKIGRKLVRDSLQIQCKCHGVSGSCNIKTCWKGLAPMPQIARGLLLAYTTAQQLGAAPPPGPGRLLYGSRSPDYCTRDARLGSDGTAGRRCNLTAAGPGGCRQLCCGRGYRTLVEERTERCQCRYYNCCYVKCNVCRTKIQIYECG